MIFYSEKFECLRFWPRVAKPEFSYSSPDVSVFEEKLHLRDLGVEMPNDLTFMTHIDNTVSSANKLIGWALRSFRRRSKKVMMTIWRSLVQSKLDYCSQIWSPSDQSTINKSESIARHFTAKVEGLQELDYWERLKTLNLYSQERRRERYQVMFR